jgi:hypothetical protein
MRLFLQNRLYLESSRLRYWLLHYLADFCVNILNFQEDFSKKHDILARLETGLPVTVNNFLVAIIYTNL